MLWCVKSSDFRAEEFALDYDHLRFFFYEERFFFVFPWVKDDFGWTNLQVQLFFYISLTESSGNDNYYSNYDFEKSRKHSHIMRNTTRLTGFITKKPGLNSNRHPLQRKDGLVNDCEGGNIYFNMTFSCLTWIISKFWPRKTFKFFVKLRELNPYKYWSPGGSFLQRN